MWRQGVRNVGLIETTLTVLPAAICVKIYTSKFNAVAGIVTISPSVSSEISFNIP